jgi:DNA repair photolyase
MKQPHLIINDQEAVNLLINHWAFRKISTPIQIFNRATDPFLPGVKEHLFSTLYEIDRRGLTNPVLVITRWHITAEDVRLLEGLKNIKLTVLVTWSGIDDRRIEPVRSEIAEESLNILRENAVRTKSILYWRPIISGLNDTDRHLERARELSDLANATVFTGLFYRKEIRDHFRQCGLPDLYEEIARRKILPRSVERRVIAAFAGRPLFRKTSCGVCFAHGTADYNGHFGIRHICDICPVEQVGLCRSAHHRPTLDSVRELASLAKLDPTGIAIDDHRIEVVGSTEQQRYFIQHSLNYQVHDRAHPHIDQRHGRAEVGWP